MDTVDYVYRFDPKNPGLKVPPSDAEALRDKIADSRLVVVEGAGHVSNMERPEEFDRALAEFLEGLPS